MNPEMPAMSLADELEKLAREATPGELIAHGWGDGSTQMGMTNIFNADAEVLLVECIPEADAALIVALRNNLDAILSALRERDAVSVPPEPVLEIIEDGMVGNTMEATFRDDHINLTIDNPWAGSTESGFGYDTHIALNREQAAQLAAWLRAHLGQHMKGEGQP